VLGADGNYGGGALLGNYGITTGSSATPPSIVIAGANFTDAPPFDFYNSPRKPGVVDAGAVQVVAGAGVAIASVTGGPLAFGNVTVGTTSASQTLTLHNTGTASLTGITLVFSSPRCARPAGAAGGTCTGTLAAASTCTVTVTFSPTAPGLLNATLTITGSVAVTGSPVGLSGTGVSGVVAATLT